ncbi:MAG TPA: glycosyltransferase family 2 protein [Acidimicrobiia bacterium]|nr:glycosyltransferase family 2 protein [Acidimicrobiia bacterium]
MTTVTVLAPAYDEEPVLGTFVFAMLDVLEPGWELLIVNDGSADLTGELAERLAAEHESVRVVHHEVNRGLGAALATGFAEARGEIVVAMDADLSHPPAMIAGLVAACEDVDAVFASRFVPGGGMEGVPLLRRAISRVGNLVFRFLFWSTVRDMTTGFRAYRTSVMRDLELTAEGFEAQLEITVRLLRRRAAIREVPLLLSTRIAGMSKMRYLALVPRYGRAVVRLLRLRWRGR